MSTITSAQRRPAFSLPKREQAPRREHLSAVESTTPKRASRVVMIPLAIIGVVVIAQLLLSFALIQGAYRESALTEQAVSLQREVTATNESVGTLSSPQNLAEKATTLGMVPSTSTGYLDLTTQTIVSGADGAGATLAGPMNTSLVANAALHPETASSKKPTEQQPSESTTDPAAAAVPSEFELSSPDTH